MKPRRISSNCILRMGSWKLLMVGGACMMRQPLTMRILLTR